MSLEGNFQPCSFSQILEENVHFCSLHGLIRGENMELGRDSDTGGQVGFFHFLLSYIQIVAVSFTQHSTILANR